MIPNVSREELLEAMETFDKALRDTEEWSSWEKKGTYKYAIVHNGQRYPVKQIISMATSEPRTNFSGGYEANTYVRKRGLFAVSLENEQDDGLSIRDGLVEILAHYATARANEPFKGHELRQTFNGVSLAIAATNTVSGRPTLTVKASMGQGNWATIPWISLLDTRETNTTQRGVYGVYLFREDMSGVYLALAQGVTELKGQYGNVAQAREFLRVHAEDLRKHCENLPQHGFDLDDDIDLHTDAALGTDYEASTIAHKFYAAGSVPDDPALVNDLEALLSAYDRYLETNETRSRLWCIYVGRQAAGNVAITRSAKIWGADAKNKFEGIRKGDSLLFVHDLTSDASPPPSGFPRVKLEDFKGTAKLLVRGTISSEVFEDHSTLWPNGTYPYRFDQVSTHLGHEQKVLIRPDIIVSEEGTVVLVTDCKYKRLEPSEFKNHDVYQMLAYCTATRVKRGLLIYPLHSAVVQDLVMIRNTDTVIRQATIDLGKEEVQELNQECDAFAQEVFTWVGA